MMTTTETATRAPYAAATITYDGLGQIEVTGQRQVGGYHVGQLRRSGRVIETGIMGWGPYSLVMAYEDEDGADTYFLVQLGGDPDTASGG